MKEKILVLLLAKFAGVRKDGLQQLANSLALQAADDNEATGLVDKLTPEKVTEFVIDWRKDVDKEVSTANKTHESTLKKKYEFVEKKQEATPPASGPQNTGGDEPPSWAKALLEQNKLLADRLTAFESGKTTETRLQKLEGKFTGKTIPEAIKSQRLKDFKRMDFKTDEDFEAYLAEVETDLTATVQELAEKGLSGYEKPMHGNSTATAEDAFVGLMKEINQPKQS